MRANRANLEVENFNLKERVKDNFGVSQKTIFSPSPREFGRADFLLESSFLRIHEERGSGGEEQES